MKYVRPVLWAGFLLIAGLLVIRAFFLRVYYVDSPSMEPALHGAPEGGDHVLVVFGKAHDIERYDLVVILPEGENEPIVKRVVGLPGESVQLRNGDLWIDGAIDRDEEVLPVPVLIFDDGSQDLTHDFRMVEAWSGKPGNWRVDAREIDPGAMAGCLYMAVGVKDQYLNPAGEPVAGRDGVGDALLECHVEVEEGGFIVHLGLVEQGDVFELLLDTADLPRVVVTLQRNHEPLEFSKSGERSDPEDLGEPVKFTELDWEAGPHEIRLGNINNRLTFEFDGELIWTSDYSSNRLFSRDTAKLGISPPTDRVFLGGHSGVARFSGIRVWRDLHFTPRGEFAIEDALQLGPDQLFLLGDNSRESRDGRDWGPTPLSAVIGRPTAIVWPPWRLRTLVRRHAIEVTVPESD